MSVTKIYRLTCDECGHEEDIETSSKVLARVIATHWSPDLRWSVNLKATPRRPSLYDTVVDLCPHDRPGIS